MKITPTTIQKLYRAKQCTVETMELKGYELVDETLVDSSGFGMENEPADTPDQYNKKVATLLEEHGALTAKITGVGMFQVYVGLFKKVRKSRMRKLENNTYKIDTDDMEAIRLHDTDILTYECDFVILNTGGWKTVTTKDRMNEYLPRGVWIEQKQFEWYVHDDRDGTVKDYEDGMRIAS